jgi:hypothetical protein
VTTLVFASLGILSASFAMVFKKGDPIAVLLGTSNGRVLRRLLSTAVAAGVHAEHLEDSAGDVRSRSDSRSANSKTTAGRNAWTNTDSPHISGGAASDFAMGVSHEQFAAPNAKAA